MSTGNKKVNIYLKKFLPQQQITENFLDYLHTLILESFSQVWQSQGVFEPSPLDTQFLSSDTIDTFDIVTPIIGTDGAQGHILSLDSDEANNIAFENALGVPYYVGLRFAEIPANTEINVRTGEVKYTFYEERIGELGEPNSVADDGDETLTMIVDNIFEAGVSHAGRKVLVYLKNAVSQVDTFEEATVLWDGVNNIIETNSALGQTLGNISVDETDYQVFAVGPTVRRNTDLRLDADIMFVGIVEGAGAGSSPTVFNQDDVQNLSFGFSGLTNLFDVEHHLGDGTHSDINPDTITTKPAIGGIQFDMQMNVADEDSPDAPVVHTLFPSAGGSGLQDAKHVFRNSAGQVIAFIDAHGNAYFQNLAAVDSVFQSNLIVEGNTTLGDDIGSDIITFNSIQQSLTDLIYVIDSNADGANSFKFYNQAVNISNLLMEILSTGDVEIQRDVTAGRDVVATEDVKAGNDVLTGGASPYSKNSDLSEIPTVASLNEVFDETLNRKLLRVTPENPASKTILIAPSFVQLADGSIYKLPSGPLLSDFGGGNINMETGVVTGGGDNFTPVDFTGNDDKWFKYSLNLLQNNELLVLSNDPLIGANFGATAELTPDPPISEDAISFAVIAVQNDSGVSATALQNIIESNITRIPVGGSGGGSGDASKILGRMEDLLDESFYRFLEPNIFSVDGDEKVDSSDASFSVVDKTYNFTVGQFLQSVELLDPEFLTEQNDILQAMIVMVFKSGNEDPAPVVEITNNGVDFEAVTMERLSSDNDTFVGNLVFDLALLVLQTLEEVTGEDSQTVLADVGTIDDSQDFTTSQVEVAEQITVSITKTGSPLGYLKINLHEDDGGIPGVVKSQSLVNIENLVAGQQDVTVEIGRHVLLNATKYHIKIETDQTYKDSFDTGVDEISVGQNSGTPSMVYKVEGRALSLILKYTASATAQLLGYGVYYGDEAQSVQRLKRRAAFVFNGTLDNLNEFQLPWNADPDFVEIQDRVTGQTWGVPTFALQNNKAVFPVDFFDGRDTVYLIAKQVEAGSYDGNPELKKLVAENHMGSNDPALDYSVPGRGPIVSTETTAIKVELTVDEDFNLVIKEA